MQDAFHDRLDEAFHDWTDGVSATGDRPRVYTVALGDRLVHIDHHAADRILVYEKAPEGETPRYRLLKWCEGEKEAVDLALGLLKPT